MDRPVAEDKLRPASMATPKRNAVLSEVMPFVGRLLKLPVKVVNRPAGDREILKSPNLPRTQRADALAGRERIRQAVGNLSESRAPARTTNYAAHQIAGNRSYRVTGIENLLA